MPSRSIRYVNRKLGLLHERMGICAGLLSLIAILCLLDVVLGSDFFRLRRVLDCVFRRRFMAKLPRLTDRWFQSPLLSDTAMRAYQVQQLRMLPTILHSVQMRARSGLFMGRACLAFR